MSEWKYLIVIFLREDFAEIHQGDTDTPLESITNYKITSKRFAIDRKDMRKIIAEIDEENEVRFEARKSIAANKRISRKYKGKMYANNFAKLHYDVIRLSTKKSIKENLENQKTARSIAQRNKRRLKKGQL